MKAPYHIRRPFVQICLLILFVANSCIVQSKVCPAYQSVFIFDKKIMHNTFGYYNIDSGKVMNLTASTSPVITILERDSVWEKSQTLKAPALPFVKRVRKGKYLLLKKNTDKRIFSNLKTVSMRPVYPLLDSALQLEREKQDSIARSQIDSIYVITSAKEKYNVDQDYYMWFLRDILVLPDVRIEQEGFPDIFLDESEEEKEKKNFFKKIFSIFQTKKKEPESEKEPEFIPSQENPDDQ